MNFTQDWFTQNINGINSVLPLVKEKKSFLEIGSFEGRSACWYMQNVIDDDGTMVCIDSFGGSLEHTGFDFEAIRARFYENTAEAKKPNQTLEVIEDHSVQGLAKLICEKRLFDYIYIDGSHTSPDTLTDACMAFPLLKKGGIMVFDDYLWEIHTAPINSPKWGIDVFTNVFSHKAMIVMGGYQVAIIKI
jgi:predicted O-methyltransferase YrrM